MQVVYAYNEQALSALSLINLKLLFIIGQLTSFGTFLTEKFKPHKILRNNQNKNRVLQLGIQFILIFGQIIFRAMAWILTPILKLPWLFDGPSSVPQVNIHCSLLVGRDLPSNMLGDQLSSMDSHPPFEWCLGQFEYLDQPFR